MDTDNKKPIYCALAFGGISWSYDGKASPCCGTRNWIPASVNSSTPLGDRINHESLVNLRKQLNQGIYPDVCNICEDQDNNGRISMRDIWNKYYERVVNGNKPNNEIVDPKNIFHVDLNIGNKCNSKCMTCVSTSSDLWLEEEQYIWSSRIKPLGTVMLNSIEKVDELLETFPNIEQYTFVGGEPTISDKLDYLLERLVNNGKSKNVSLSYTTNLTGINSKLLDVWSQFKHVGISVSIDGYGKVNDYIRYPFKWDKVERNLDEVIALVKTSNQFGLNLGLTASIFNCIYTHELLEFWYDRVKDIPKTCGIMINKAVDPHYVDMRILKSSYREQGIHDLLNLKANIANDIRFEPLVSAIDSMISYLNEPEFENKQLKDRARHFIKSSDKFRQRNVDDFLPGLLQNI